MTDLPSDPCCIVCEEAIESFVDGDPANPVNAVTMSIPGNSGSRLFPGGSAEYLRAYLCDPCARIEAGNNHIQLVALTVTTRQTDWRPGLTFTGKPSMYDRRPSFTCPDCGRTSYHPEDVKNSYCGNCHAFKPEEQPDPS